MPQAVRTIVKSPPELWAEVSDPTALTRHLGAFGEIRITRLEPEATVAWEGDRASGTVTLEPAGWGTKVRVVAEEAPAVAESDPEPAPEPEPAPDPEPSPEPVPVPVVAEAPPEHDPEAVAADVEQVEDTAEQRRGFFARLFRRRGAPLEVSTAVEHAPLMFTPEPVTVEYAAVVAEPELEPETAVEPEPEPEAVAEPEPEEDAVDTAAILDGMLDSLGAAHHRPFSRG